MRLADYDSLHQQIDDLKKNLESKLPGEMEKIHQEKVAALKEDEKAALEKKPQVRSQEEIGLAMSAEGKTKVTWPEVILRAPPEQRTELRKLNDELVEAQHKINTIDTYRDIVNYNYWDARCKAEPTEACLAARELVYQAQQAYKATKLFEAKKLYEEAFAKWRTVLDRYPVLRSSSIMADDLVDNINQYKKVLGKIPGSKFPEKFVLQDMIDLNDGKTLAPAADGPHTPETSPAAKKNDRPAKSA